MKKVSVQVLKATLSSLVAEAESGETIIVTRHNQPVAQLGPSLPHVRRATGTSLSALKPAIKNAKRIPYMEVLLDDRGDR